MASGDTLAAIGWMPSRLSTRQDCLPPTTPAAQAWLNPELADVAAGCEAWASSAASAAIRAAAEGAEVAGVTGVTVADALPAASAGPRAMARAARGMHHLRSMGAPCGC